MNVKEFYKYAKRKLYYMEKVTFDFEMRMLLEKYLGFNDIDVILNRERKLSDLEFKNLEEAINLRTKKIPLQYILGNWNFMDVNLEIGEGVLIPREDTQILVEVLNIKLKGKNSCKIIDICSGSGCIALAAENLNKNAHEIYALEKSAKAYKYLVKNINNLNSKVKAINSDLLIEHKNFKDNFFDFIVSNPPYIKTNEINFLQAEVLHEPKIALDGGKNGLTFYESICKIWVSKLKPRGSLIFEIGKDQFEDVKKIMKKNNLEQIEYKKDINGIIRVISGIKKY